MTGAGVVSVSIRDVRNWWKAKTGKDDSPLDGETPFWIFSLLFHVALLLVLASCLIEGRKQQRVSVRLDPETPDVVELPPLVEIEYEDDETVGNNESDNFEAMAALTPAVDEIAEIDMDVQQDILDLGDFQLDEYLPEMAEQPDVSSIAVHGVAGLATQGTDGAIDRITQEILLSLEERKTLVIWMFDQSASLLRQRDEILSRFDNVYDELNRLQAGGAEAFAKHDDIPLLSQVVAFGSRNELMLKKPEYDVERIKQAVRDIQVDDSGVENVFAAVINTCRMYRNLSRVNRLTGQRERNVMIVILSDECGDDIENVDEAIDLCKQGQVRVYTIGVPAPFGRENTYVKWVDPDPAYDQSVQWAPVRQGPETFLPERINLNYTRNIEEEAPIDSGFGPYGLTRLSYQSGGMYFTVHPNRKISGEQIPRWETATYSAYLTRFFDPEVMRPYRPDYVSAGQYLNQVKQNKSREALLVAARQSRLQPLTPPALRFEKLDEATFVNSVSRAQRAAAVLEPRINRLYEILAAGEKDRQREVSLRWKAGYDLALGRVLAVKVRAESYNAMLALAKTSLKFQNPENNTWILEPADEISTGSQSEKLAAQAKMYLQRVVAEHPETPWAALAAAELATPIGWRWTETWTRPPDPPPERMQNNNNNPPRPRPQQPMAPPPKQKRPPPKL